MPVYKVLYVEDDESDIRLMQQGIDKKKFEIIAEVYGNKAVEKIKEDTEGNIKAVLLDIRLIDPKTDSEQNWQGEEVLSKIRALKPEIPVIAVSLDNAIAGADLQGYFPKKTLFKSKRNFRDLEETLSERIADAEKRYYPPDGGGSEWQRRWGPEYIRFRNSNDFPSQEAEIGQEAWKDFELLSEKKIENYRRYRGTRSLRDVLIARRVIFADCFEICRKGEIDFDQVCEDLGYPREAFENLKNFMNACGIKWAGIRTGSALLEEEKKWLKDKGLFW
jgi:CheY-like chemotaxis protein